CGRSTGCTGTPASSSARGGWPRASARRTASAVPAAVTPPRRRTRAPVPPSSHPAPTTRSGHPRRWGSGSPLRSGCASWLEEWSPRAPDEAKGGTGARTHRTRWKGRTGRTTAPTPAQLRELQDELARQRSQAATVGSQNERLVRTLKDARQQIVTLREELERLAQPPSSYAVIVAVHEDQTADVLSGGRKMHVA